MEFHEISHRPRRRNHQAFCPDHGTEDNDEADRKRTGTTKPSLSAQKGKATEFHSVALPLFIGSISLFCIKFLQEPAHLLVTREHRRIDGLAVFVRLMFD